jgi:dTDP-4-dehydrorhamnose 3,5-epimerase-like enzyme
MKRKNDSGNIGRKGSREPILKGRIDTMLKEIPLKKVRRARRLFKEWWCYEWLDEKHQLEQIYRAFYSSYKTRRSYWHFKTASVLLLYLYGYISNDEMD